MTVRLLTIMGSGETAPTMVEVHKRLIARSGEPAVLLDTPFGFQENADQLTDRAREYFARSVGVDLQVARWRSAGDPIIERERALALLDRAGYVFAGPGSPTYALDQWRGSPLRDVLGGKLERGGAVTFASAAALTLGRVSVPVYEIYKVGRAPVWAEGLDLMSALGLDAAVIPHYDNAEGGNHDTRFCYLGERRLAVLEEQLPQGCFVLGVDEHTGLVFDLEAGTAEVVGNSTVTVRRDGSDRVFETGTTLTFDELREAEGDTAVAASRVSVPAEHADTAPARSVLDDARRLESEFDTALGRGDVPAAVAAVLELDDSLQAWAADPTQSDETDRARAVHRRMTVRLGELAEAGVRDPDELVGPFVDVALEARRAAREAKQYDLADRIRDGLVEAGIEIRDAPDGTTWQRPATD